MHDTLENQYRECDCESCRTLKLSDGKPKDFSRVQDAANEAFKKLHELGKYNPKDLNKVKEFTHLIQESTEVLKSAISHEIPDEMKSYLEIDVFVFSGLKTHAQLTDARNYLKDESGNIRPYHQFEQKALELNDKYNRNYLEAEYEFAVQSSQSAANWAYLQTNTDRYWLEYRTAGDERVRAEHQALNGTCLPANDNFWDSYYPPNGWRCRCVAIEVLAQDYELSDSKKAIENGEKATTQINKSGKNSLEMFRFNPGKEMKVFPPGNAYEKVVGAKEIKKEAIKELYSKEDVEKMLSVMVESKFEWYKDSAPFDRAKKYNLNEIEGFGIYEYTRDFYEYINDYLRLGNKDMPAYESYLKITNAGLNKIPDYKGEVYRGVHLPDEIVKDIIRKAGTDEPHIENAFVSTSADPTKSFDKSTIFKIQSKTGKSIAHNSAFGNTEDEVLFKPGTNFKIVKALKTDTGYEIHMEEL